MNVYPSPPPQPYHNEHNSAGLEIFVNFLFTKQNSLIVLFLKRFFKQCPHRKFIVTPSTHSMYTVRSSLKPQSYLREIVNKILILSYIRYSRILVKEIYYFGPYGHGMTYIRMFIDYLCVSRGGAYL